MEILYHKKSKNKKNKELKIISKNDIYNLIIKYKKGDVIIKLIELKEIINVQKEKYYINKSNIYYTGKFKYNDIKHLLEILNKKNYENILKIKKKNDIIIFENIALKEEKYEVIKEIPNNEIYNKQPLFKSKEKFFSLKQLKLNNNDLKVYNVFYYNKYFNELCLILLQNQASQISVMRIKDLSILLTINLNIFTKPRPQMHESPPVLKHFFADGKDHIVYAFKNSMIIYDLNMNKAKYIIKTSPKFYIEKLLFINNSNEKFLILNQINLYRENNYLLLGEKNKVINLNKWNVIKEIENTENDVCYNLIHWNNDFIIKFCLNYIILITKIIY